jgi:hypothetical protein
MILRNKIQRGGKGIKYRANYRYRTRRGNGFFDFFKPVIPIIKTLFQNKDKIMSTAKYVYNIGKNTKDIVQAIRKPAPPAPTLPVIIPPSLPVGIDTKDIKLESIINRINQLRTGSSISRHTRMGKGFSYV